ncbi:hypothetical protein DMENIID0001_135220 [Sergentomyia squamirostris]
MFSADDLMIPLASMFDYEDAPPEQRASARRSTTAQKDYTWVPLDDDAVPDFKIKWNLTVDQKEKELYRAKYPRVDGVVEDRIHCTSCDGHLSTAPIDEVVIREHPVMKTSQCSKCYAFYTSGEFDKGEDGSELYCRWCGQGGEVFCCAECPYVFCKKCILRNLNKGVLKGIMDNDDWVCFACKPEVTWPLRARHWALMNFIEKQRKIILSQYTSDSDVNFLMSRDMSKCCAAKVQIAAKDTRKSTSSKSTPTGKQSTAAKSSPATFKTTPTGPKRKRKADEDFTPPGLPPKRGLGTADIPPLERQPPPPLQNQRSQAEVVCTPDIMSMFEPSTNTVTPSPPPPLTSLRQYGGPTNPITNGSTTITRTAPQKKTQTITIANQSPATPIYHTINGYRIDLNSAARQETIRLPNGKLIQVKKQSTPQTSAQQAPPPVPSIMSPPVRNFRPQLPSIRPQMPTVRLPMVPRAAVTPVRQRRQVRTGPGMMTPQAAQQQNQARPFVLNGMMQPQALNMPPLIISQQMANTPYGKAKMELDGRIRNGQEICMHIIGKMNTLVASNAYKSMKSPKDVKEIHIHLSYLLTYAINRFKTLQEKSMENMKALGFGGDVESIMSGKIQTQTNPEDNDDDDIEIVEPQTTLIDLASDEEETTPAKVVQAKVTPSKAVPAKEASAKRDKGGPASKTGKPVQRKEATENNDNEMEITDTIDETPMAKESQMFLDKLKLQPKILLKKLGGTPSIDAKIREKENEGIVKDLLNELLDKVMKSVTGESAGSAVETNGDQPVSDLFTVIDLDDTVESSDADDTSNKEPVTASETGAMDVDEPVYTIDDDSSSDISEVTEKVQNDENPKENEDVSVMEKSGTTDVEMSEGSDKGGEEKAKEVQEDEDVEMVSAEVEEELLKEPDDSKEGDDIEAPRNPPEDHGEKTEDSSGQKEPVEKIGDEIPDTNSIVSNDDFKDAEDAVLASIARDDAESKEPEAEDNIAPDAEKKTEDVVVPPQPVSESPASPDAAAVGFNQEFRAFEDIDSPDEFDDALEGQANGDALLNDLDSLGKFLDN